MQEINNKIDKNTLSEPIQGATLKPKYNIPSITFGTTNQLKVPLSWILTLTTRILFRHLQSLEGLHRFKVFHCKT